MYLLTAVINNEDLIDEIITGWMEIGITDTTVIETTDALQLISHHIPIFAGFRALTSGGMRHNKTVFSTINDQKTLKTAVTFLEKVCMDSGKTKQGNYFVIQLKKAGLLGENDD